MTRMKKWKMSLIEDFLRLLRVLAGVAATSQNCPVA